MNLTQPHRCENTLNYFISKNIIRKLLLLWVVKVTWIQQLSRFWGKYSQLSKLVSSICWLSWRLEELIINIIVQNSQNTKPRLLVTNSGGSGCHTLNGLWQKVNYGNKTRKIILLYDPKKIQQIRHQHNGTSIANNYSCWCTSVVIWLGILFFVLPTIKIPPSCICEQRVHDLIHITAPMSVLHHMG